MPLSKVIPVNFIELLVEVALEQSGEGLSVARLIPCHFMHSVMDGIEVQLLGQLGLACGRAVFGFNAYFPILLDGLGSGVW